MNVVTCAWQVPSTNADQQLTIGTLKHADLQKKPDVQLQAILGLLNAESITLKMNVPKVSWFDFMYVLCRLLVIISFLTCF